jgi:hypothetical protein
MTITRGIAVAATSAATAVGAATPASATPVMSGHYIETTTNSAGQSTTNDWNFTPCGDGCASVVSANGYAMGQARLVNGQWTLDTTVTASCNDGTMVPSGGHAHYVWDANTLAGTDVSTWNSGVCPADPPSATLNIQLRQSPTSPSQQAPEKG